MSVFFADIPKRRSFCIAEEHAFRAVSVLRGTGIYGFIRTVTVQPLAADCGKGACVN